MRAITPDVGGGFGLRMNVYPEQVMVAVAARALERPVKWLGDRSECFLTDFQGRDLVTDARLALDRAGPHPGDDASSIPAGSAPIRCPMCGCATPTG